MHGVVFVLNVTMYSRRQSCQKRSQEDLESLEIGGTNDDAPVAARIFEEDRICTVQCFDCIESNCWDP